MSKLSGVFIFLTLIMVFFILKTPNAYAAPCPITILVNGIETTTFPPDFSTQISGKQVTLKSPGCFENTTYQVRAFPSSNTSKIYFTTRVFTDEDNIGDALKSDLSTLSSGLGKSYPGTWILQVCEDNCKSNANIRASTTFEVSTVNITPPVDTPGFEDPIINLETQAQCKFQVDKPIRINQIKNIKRTPGVYMWWWGGDWPPGKKLPEDQQYDPDEQTLAITIPAKDNDKWGYRTFCINQTKSGMVAHNYNCLPLTITKNEPTDDISCQKLLVPTKCSSDKQCKDKDPDKPICNKESGQCIAPTLAGGKETPGCNDPNDPNDPAKPNPNPGVATAIGCIHTNPVEFTKDLMRFVIGISGGLAFLMMLLGAFQILSSADNPDTLKAGRERLTSAVIGLLIVIFAILLLQIIGVGILDIPGFGK